MGTHIESVPLGQLINSLLGPVHGILAPDSRLINLEQPPLFVFNLALLNSLQSAEKFDTNRTWLIGGIAVGELLALGFQGDGLDGYKSCCCAGGKNFVKLTQL